jgi:mRNA interferase MazF
MTSNVDCVYPFQALVTADTSGLEQDSKAQAEQVRWVSVDRVGERVGHVAATAMLEIDDALRLHLEL